MLTSHLPRLLLALAALLSCTQALAQSRNLAVQNGEKRLALVIGNDNYRTVSALRNARADASAIAKALTDAGFAVTLSLDADEKTLKAALRNFKARIGGGEVAVFYYSGHGVQLGAANYMLPVDIRDESEEQIKDDAVPLQRVLDDLQEQKARFSLAIVDACRNNPFRSRGRAIGGRGLAPTTAATGQMVIYSAGAGQEALDRLGNNDRDPNGLFTRVFLKEIEKPGVPVDRLLRNVREEVVRLAKNVGHEQVPALYDQALGDFYFRPPGAQASAQPPAVPSAPSGGGVSLDDLKQQQASRAQWAKWQTGMKADYDKILALNAAPDLQAAAWERFLGSYAQDNPYSGEDAEMRAEAAKRKQAAEAASARQKEEAESKRRAAAQVALAPASASAIQQAAPTGTISAAGAGRSFRDCDVCPEMVVIPAGSFVMGSPASESQRYDNEGPQHQVRISRAFAAGKYEVTFDEWDACVRESGCGTQAEDRGWGRGRRPVINVSWNDAKQYTAWLSRKTGKNYRLLSEAEWEYAARAGTSTAFAFGNSITPQQANYDSKVSYAGSPTATSQGKTVQVGSFPANAFGLHDMHGNVWEWTEDCYNGSYSGAPTDGSPWTAGDCGQRVLRGGSWDYYPWDLRSAYRIRYDPTNRVNYVGFRVSRTN